MARLESLHPVCTPVHSAGLAATPARGPPGLARRRLPAPAPSSPCCCSGYSFSVCSSSAWNRGLLRGKNRHSPWPRLATLPPRRCPGLASCHALLVLGREAQPARPRPPPPPPHAAQVLQAGLRSTATPWPGLPYRGSGPRSPSSVCSSRLWVSWELPLPLPHQAGPLLRSHRTRTPSPQSN